MKYVFSFSSRNAAMRFLDAVNASGGRASLVNSPQTGSHGCGLGVKCDDYELCRGVLNRGYYSSLRAIFSLDQNGYKTIYSTEN